MTVRAATAAAVLVGWWALGAWTPSAHAQSSVCYPPPSEDQRARANELAATAYELHGQARYAEAAQAYEQALAHAQDARLHLQAGTTFFGALDIVKAFEHLDEALRCGGDMFDAEDIAEARRKLDVLYARLGRITVDCRADQGQVELNGAAWFACPGERSAHVVAGQHSLTVTRPGHFTVDQTQSVSPGEHVTMEPRLVSVEDGTLVNRRWPRWRPWALVGGGAALGLVAGGLMGHASALMNESTARLDEVCPVGNGCTGTESEALFAEQDRAFLENRVGIGVFAVGSAALVAGLAMVYFNRPTITRSPEAGSARVRVEPMARGDGGGLSLRVDL